MNIYVRVVEGMAEGRILVRGRGPGGEYEWVDWFD
jgi:hypothetical protein